MSAELAKQIATRAHAGQFRRDGVTPYIVHPEAVAARVIGDTAKAVAWLHDVLEDTKLTVVDLEQAGFSREITKAVVALTKDDGTDYETYLQGFRRNNLARRVKIADILANLSDQPTETQIVKYVNALRFLINAQ